MDGISAKKHGILKAFIDLADSGTEDVSSLMQSNLKFFLDSCCDGDLLIVEMAVTLLLKLSVLPKCRQSLLAAGAIGSLNDIAASDDISAHLRDLVARTVKNLKTLGGVGSSGAGAGGVGAPAKREIRGVHLNMDNLLGKKAEEDQYIKALLLVDGVTSVTIDRTRSLAIVYTTEEREMKGLLYDKVQAACDRLRDAAGLRRINVRKADHAAYLEDDEDEEDEEDEDFFAEGSKSRIVAVNAGGKAGAPGGGRSAAEILREKDAAAASAASNASRGIFGWFGF